VSNTNRLTKQAAARYADMADGVEEAQNHAHAIQRRIGEIERQIGNKNPKTQADEIAVYREDLDRQRGRFEGAQHTFLALARVHTAVRTWLDMLSPAAELEDVEPELVELESGEDHSDAVLRVRCDIEELVKTRSDIYRAVPPIEELIVQANVHVDALAARGAPRLYLDGERLVIKHDVEGGAAQSIALLAWLHPDDTKERLHDQIERQRERELREGALVMSTTERAESLTSLDGLILSKEREEEYLIREAEENNTTIPRREKANPAAILGVRVVPRSKNGVASGAALQVAASITPGRATGANNRSSHPRVR
jgi:hypothetical protein